MNGLSNLSEYIMLNGCKKVKLHLGCGGVRWKDFINVDFNPYISGVKDSSRSGCVADVIADMRNLAMDESSIDEIFTSHTIDHFFRWEALDMLSDWYRMLKPGAKLVIETADFYRCIFWLFHPSKTKRYLAKTQFYGNQWDRLEYEAHKYVWSVSELKAALASIGYRYVSVTHATETHYAGRDMRVEAYK